MLRNLICLTLMTVVASGVVADEKQKKGKNRKAKTPSVTQRFVGKLDLTAEQKEKVAAIDKQFAAKAQELQKQRAAILSPEQKKAQQDAQKAAKAAGKSGPEARKAVDAALNLSEEQKAKMKEHGKAQQQLSAEVIAALKKILTEEQQAKLPKQRGGKDGAKKGKGKKKKDAA